jgi:hypothetical protein
MSPFAVLRDGREVWGYIARNGKVLIEPQFASAGEFSADGLARASFTRDRDAYIDRRGNVLSPIFDHAGDFFDGVAVVGMRQDKWLRIGLINRKFKYILQPEYLELRRLLGQIYVARKNTGNRFQTISTNGKVIFEFPPDTIGVNVLPNVSHGAIAYGIRIAGEEKKFVYIDQAGKPFPDNFVLSEFGLATVGKPGPVHGAGEFLLAGAGLVRQWMDRHRNRVRRGQSLAMARGLDEFWGFACGSVGDNQLDVRFGNYK